MIWQAFPDNARPRSPAAGDASGKFAHLTIMYYEDADKDSMITTFITAVTETTTEVLDKHRQKKNPGSLQKFLICATTENN